MSNEYKVYYVILLFVILIGAIATGLARLWLKLDFPEDKLRLMQKKYKKGMIIFFITMLLSLTTIIPLHIFSPKDILMIQFIILFFAIIFIFLFLGYAQTYWLIHEKLQCEEAEPEYYI
jgi:hypothetical protein